MLAVALNTAMLSVLMLKILPEASAERTDPDWKLLVPALTITMEFGVPDKDEFVVSAVTNDVMLLPFASWLNCRLVTSSFCRRYFQPGVTSLTLDIFGAPGSLCELCA